MGLTSKAGFLDDNDIDPDANVDTYAFKLRLLAIRDRILRSAPSIKKHRHVATFQANEWADIPKPFEDKATAQPRAGPKWKPFRLSSTCLSGTSLQNSSSPLRD
jgi:hypothetical protein